MWPILNLNQALAYLDQIRIAYDGVDGDRRSSARRELEHFYLVHARTWLRTLELVRQAFPAIERPLRVLDLGASPYFFTALLAEHIPCEIVGSTVPVSSWPGEPFPIAAYPVVLERGPDRPPLELTSWTFNIEKDTFPFPDQSFDLVLCMEVMEHLTYSPSHTLAEAHRVLRQDGHLVITIPNYLRSQRLVEVLLGRPDDFTYTGSGIQGRHQRELTQAELRLLLEACNYRVERLDVAMVWPWSTQTTLPGRVVNALIRGFLDLPLAYARNRRELVLALAAPVGAPKLGYLPLLYDDPPAFPQTGRRTVEAGL